MELLRPGFHRVDATFQPRPGVVVVAFKGNDQNVIVAVNQNENSVSQTFVLRNESVVSRTKYITSAEKKLNEEGTATIDSNRFTDLIDPQSITTYVVTKNNTSVSGPEKPEIRIFPNPANDYLQISSIRPIQYLEVWNLMGQKLITQTDGVNQTIDISDLIPGIYLLKLKNHQNEQIFRFIKN